VGEPIGETGDRGSLWIAPNPLSTAIRQKGRPVRENQSRSSRLKTLEALSAEEASSELQAFINTHFELRRVQGVGGLRGKIGSALPQGLRTRLRLILTDAVAPFEARKAKRLVARFAPGAMRLHLGCGAYPLTGWLNVDLAGLKVDLRWNLNTTPFPFADDSIDAIFHEHTLEHLTAQKGLNFTRDCYRVLKPGGILRFGVPDARRYFEAYAGINPGFLLANWGMDEPIYVLNAEIYGQSHKQMYDERALYRLLLVAGFEQIHFCEPGETDLLQPAPYSERRKGDTLYVEATKPRRV
jgi:predicted SAM-dependent methyltransferase